MWGGEGDGVVEIFVVGPVGAAARTISLERGGVGWRQGEAVDGGGWRVGVAYLASLDIVVVRICKCVGRLKDCSVLQTLINLSWSGIYALVPFGRGHITILTRLSHTPDGSILYSLLSIPYREFFFYHDPNPKARANICSQSQYLEIDVLHLIQPFPKYIPFANYGMKTQLIYTNMLERPSETRRVYRVLSVLTHIHNLDAVLLSSSRKPSPNIDADGARSYQMYPGLQVRAVRTIM